MQVISKKRKVSTQNQTRFSGRNQKFKVFFWPKSGDFQKKKALHRLWVSSRTKKLHYSGPNNGKFFTTSAPKSLWGGLFSFLEQKSASKALKTCYFAYFSGQWGSSSSPHPPADYATGRSSATVIYYPTVYILSLCQQRTNPLL